MQHWIFLFIIFMLYNIAFTAKEEDKKLIYIAWGIIAQFVIAISSVYIPGWIKSGEVTQTFVEWVPQKTLLIVDWIKCEIIIKYPKMSIFILLCASTGFIYGFIGYGPICRNYDGIKLFCLMFPFAMIFFLLKYTALLSVGLLDNGYKEYREKRESSHWYALIFSCVLTLVFSMILPFALTFYFYGKLVNNPITAMHIFAIYCLIVFFYAVCIKALFFYRAKKADKDISQKLRMQPSELMLNVLLEAIPVIFFLPILAAWWQRINELI